MKMLRKPPIRTYARKKLTTHAVELYQSQINLSPKKRTGYRKSTKPPKTIDPGQHPDADNSLGDPFETTFDRLLKGTVNPPPLPAESDASWLSSSSENSDEEFQFSAPFHVANSLHDISITNREVGKKRKKQSRMTVKKKTLIKTPKSGKKARAKRKKVQHQKSINMNKSHNKKIISKHNSGNEISDYSKEPIDGLTREMSNNNISMNYNNKNFDSFFEKKNINSYKKSKMNNANEKTFKRKHQKTKTDLKEQNSTNLLHLSMDLNTLDISQHHSKLVQRKRLRNKKNANNSTKNISVMVNAWAGLNEETGENNSSSQLHLDINTESSSKHNTNAHIGKESSRFGTYNLSESLEGVKIKPCSVMLTKSSTENSKIEYSYSFNMQNDLCGFRTNGDIVFKSPASLLPATELFCAPSIETKNCSVYLNRIKPPLSTDISEKSEQTLICSTPMGKPKKRPNHLITISPIIHVQHLGHQLSSTKMNTIFTDTGNKPTRTDDTCKLSTYASVINNEDECIEKEPIMKFASICSSENSEKILNASKDTMDVQLDPTQILIPSQSYGNLLDDEKFEEKVLEDGLNISNTRKLQSQCLLNVSEASDRTRSLFDDTNNKSNFLKEDNLTNKFNNSSGFSSISSCGILERIDNIRPLNSENVSEASLINNISSPKIGKLSFNLKECVVNLTQQYTEDMRHSENDFVREKSKQQSQNEESEIDIRDEILNAVQSVQKTSTVSIESMCDTQTNSDNNDSNRLSARLQDPFRITDRRKRNRKWNLQLADICEIQDDGMKISENEEFQPKKLKKAHEDGINNSLFTNASNNLFPLERHSTVQSARTSVYLKPGKFWARSLSILNSIQKGFNLDDLSVGKGKKWRHSVKDILSMQEQGIIQSCVKNVGDVKDNTSYSETVPSNSQYALTDNRFSTFGCNANRFSRRVSVRVVPDSKRLSCIEDNTPFREVYGITGRQSRTSVLPKLRESTQHDIYCSNENIENDETHSATTAKEVVLQRCGQDDYLDFEQCFPDSYLECCKKIGEGVYGEVFLYENEQQRSVIKIIPIEGNALVNGEPQKKFDEILSEIVISKELHNLRFTETYNTSGFVEVVSVKCIIGKYPEKLVELWTAYDEEKTSDNDCPSMFNENQLYIALELGHGGQDLEAFVFQTAVEAYAVFVQTALALAVAEKSLEFEHRDLHWGNVLISRTNESNIHYKLDNKDIFLPSKGVKVSIIDFTLSRMSYEGCCIFNDLALDPALFTAQGEYQFEIYRLMRDKTRNNWQNFEPYTNVLWLHYTLDKMITAARYKKKTLKMHKKAIVDLMELKGVILDYDSASDFVMNCEKFVNLCNKATPVYTSVRPEPLKTRRVLANPVAV